MQFGSAEIVAESKEHPGSLPFDHRLLQGIPENSLHRLARTLYKLLTEKARLDGRTGCWTMRGVGDKSADQGSWLAAVKALENQELEFAWGVLTQQRGGSRSTWELQTVERVAASAFPAKVQMIPAIRQIGAGDTKSEGFDGAGVIDRLARLQNPDVLNQEAKKRFISIQSFLRNVVSRVDATIEIPYARDTILIHMDGKVLPIESLGSGIHEVIILAAAATILQNNVVCIEEPELHLNPILQRKLARYLSANTDNQYFISTHSAALMDTPDAEIYHIRLDDNVSVVERVSDLSR